MKNILIVDDEPDIISILDAYIQDGSRDDEFNIEGCLDGADAFEKIKANEYDLVITDLMMPKINGLELIELIKNEAGNTKTAIICCSAFLPKIDANVSASLLENVFFIEKPVDFDKFKRVFKLASICEKSA